MDETEITERLQGIVATLIERGLQYPSVKLEQSAGVDGVLFTCRIDYSEKVVRKTEWASFSLSAEDALSQAESLVRTLGAPRPEPPENIAENDNDGFWEAFKPALGLLLFVIVIPLGLAVVFVKFLEFLAGV